MKSLLLIVLLGCVAMATADCDNLKRLKVKQQWSVAFGAGDARQDFGIALWRAMFNQDPSARQFFKRVDGDDVESPKFLGHAQRVLGGLDMVISLLDEDAVADAQLDHLQGQHATRNLPAGAFETFGNSLFATVASQLGRCFDRPAWEACYDYIAKGIIG